MEWIYAVGAGLSAGIGFIAKALVQKTRDSEKALIVRVDRAEEKLENCEEKHEANTAILIDLTGRLGMLEGKQEGVTSFAKEALDIIDRNTRHDARPD